MFKPRTEIWVHTFVLMRVSVFHRGIHLDRQTDGIGRHSESEICTQTEKDKEREKERESEWEKTVT